MDNSMETENIKLRLEIMNLRMNNLLKSQETVSSDLFKKLEAISSKLDSISGVSENKKDNITSNKKPTSKKRISGVNFDRLNSIFKNTSLNKAEEQPVTSGVKVIYSGKQIVFRSVNQASNKLQIAWNILRNRKVNNVINLDKFLITDSYIPADVDEPDYQWREHRKSPKSQNNSFKKMDFRKPVYIKNGNKVVQKFSSQKDFQKYFNLSYTEMCKIADKSRSIIKSDDLNSFLEKQSKEKTLFTI